MSKNENTFFIWQYGEPKNSDNVSFRLQIKIDGRSYSRFNNFLVSEGWKQISYTSNSKKTSYCYQKDFDSKESAKRWAKKFPEPLYYMDRYGKEFLWNSKTKRGRPKK